MLVRPFQTTHIEAVNALHTDISWSPRSVAQWQWLASNPAQANAPIGWVLDNNGSIDGFIGNFRQTYWRNRTAHLAATSYSVIVSPRAKGSVRQLIGAFLEQGDVFAASILNSNTIGAPIYRKLGFTAFPVSTHALKLSWILNAPQVLAARALRPIMERSPQLEALAGERFTPARAVYFDARQVQWPPQVHVISDLSDNGAFGTFWKALKAQGRLLAERSPAIMRWRMAQPDLTTRPLLIGWHDEQGLSAYAMAQLSKTGPVDVSMLEVIDVMALDHAAQTAVPTLIGALHQAAKAMGAAKLRIPMLSPQLLEQLGPQTKARDEGGWGHAHVHFIGQPDDFADWQPTGFDGSYGYNMRQPHFRLKRPPRAVRKRNHGLSASET